MAASRVFAFLLLYILFECSENSELCQNMAIKDCAKDFALHVTKSNCPLVHQYVINENNLSAVDKHKHLGIWIESSLSGTLISVTLLVRQIEYWV